MNWSQTASVWIAAYREIDYRRVHIVSVSGDAYILLEETAGLSRGGVEMRKEMSMLTERNDAVRKTSESSAGVVGESERGAEDIITSLVDTEATFNSLFSDVGNVERAVMRIKEIGSDNLTTIMDMRKRLEEI